MKTISGQCASMKEISLSKAAKILSKFVSADNGASQIINAYLHRASASFNELDQLHKELKLSRSHKKKKHKKHGMETGDEENFAQIVETNQELSHGNVKSKNDFRRQWIGSENTDEDDKKSTQNVVKVSQELNGSIGYQAGNLGGNEKKHKKNKKNKQEDESRLDVDSEVPTRAHNEILSGQEKDNEGDINPGMKEGKKHKKEKKKKKKHKEGTGSFSSNKGEVENLEGEVAKGQEQNKVEKRLTISVEGENGGLVDSDNLRSRKEKKYEAGSEDKLHAEELKMEQKKKRKYEVVEGRLEDKSGDLTKKRMKRKHEGDP